MQTHRDVPLQKAPRAFGQQNTLRLVSFALLTLPDHHHGPRAETEVPTRYPIDCTITLVRKDSDQSHYRFIINFERFRMTGTTCESRLAGASSGLAEAAPPAFPAHPFGPVTVFRSTSALVDEGPFRADYGLHR